MSKQLEEEVLVVHLHNKVFRFLFHTARKAYFIKINEDKSHRISPREVDILMKAFEIVKLKMEASGGLVYTPKRS